MAQRFAAEKTVYVTVPYAYTHKDFEAWRNAMAVDDVADSVYLRLACDDVESWNFDDVLRMNITELELVHRDMSSGKLFDYIAKTETVFVLYVNPRILSNPQFCAAFVANKSIRCVGILPDTEVITDSDATMFANAALARPRSFRLSAACLKITSLTAGYAQGMFMHSLCQLVRENKLIYVDLPRVFSAADDSTAALLADALQTTTALVGLGMDKKFLSDRQQQLILAPALQKSRVEYMYYGIAPINPHPSCFYVIPVQNDRLYIKHDAATFGMTRDARAWIARLQASSVSRAVVREFHLLVSGDHLKENWFRDVPISHDRLLRALWALPVAERFILVWMRDPLHWLTGMSSSDEAFLSHRFIPALRARALHKACTSRDDVTQRWPTYLREAEYVIATLAEKFSASPWEMSFSEWDVDADNDNVETERDIVVSCRDGQRVVTLGVPGTAPRILAHLPCNTDATPILMPDFISVVDFVPIAERPRAAVSDIEELTRQVVAANYLHSPCLGRCVKNLLVCMQDCNYLY